MVELVQQIRMCYDSAFHCYGTAAIFERRANGLRPWRGALAFLGFVVPLLVGGIALTFNIPKVMPILVLLAGVAGFIQILASAWATINNWEDRFHSSQHTAVVNYDLAAQFESLARTATADEDILQEWRRLDAVSRHQSTFDYKHSITQDEKCWGMRVALRKYERPCS